MHGWLKSSMDVAGRVLRRCDLWCHWHGRAQKPLFWAFSGCDIVASLSRFALRNYERGVAVTVVEGAEGMVYMRRLANLGPDRRRVLMATRADAAMPEALQWIWTEGAWRCCPFR